jgi:NADH-quinone oxidoreductase subunit H
MSLHDLLWTFLKIFILVNVVLIHVAYATYFERKAIGHMQVRLGPMRVGPHGLLQPIADFVKLFFKEDIIPTQADKPIFFMAPVIGVIAAVASWRSPLSGHTVLSLPAGHRIQNTPSWAA